MQRSKKLLKDCDEDEIINLIKKICKSEKIGVECDIGDDCAVVASTKSDSVLKCDSVVEGVHFRNDAKARLIGRKALARSLSDIGAMGAKPKHALVAISIQVNKNLNYIGELYKGMKELCEQFELNIIGGELSRIPAKSAAVISVFVLGEKVGTKVLTRCGAKIGDTIFVSGELGGSLLSGKHLDFTPRINEGIWLAQKGFANSMMDISDGLVRDLPRLCLASNCSAQLNFDTIPITNFKLENKSVSLTNALGDGEDYELLFTTSARKVCSLRKTWREKFPKLRLSKIGEIVEIDSKFDNMSELIKTKQAWDHFKQG